MPSINGHSRRSSKKEGAILYTWPSKTQISSCKRPREQFTEMTSLVPKIVSVCRQVKVDGIINSYTEIRSRIKKGAKGSDLKNYYTQS